jgi:5-methylcytosine-specific restriction protein A
MAILLTWSPKAREHNWQNMPEASTRTLSGEVYPDWWNVGHSTKQVKKGSRLFLLRQGEEPKGIVGSAWAISSPYERRMAETGKVQQAVNVVFDLVLDPFKFRPLDWHTFTTGPLSEVHWNTQTSGIRVPDELETQWREHVSKVLGYIPIVISENSDEIEFPEGKASYRLHRQIERNRQVVKDAKAKAKREGRFYCWACHFDFAGFYGETGEGYVEAHHTIPVSEIGENGSTKIEDMAMVCSNCHRMLHRKAGLTIDELAEIIAAARAAGHEACQM